MKCLMADSISGIWEVAVLDGEVCEVMTQQEFADELDTLREGRVIACQADAEYCARFERNYFVQSLKGSKQMSKYNNIKQIRCFYSTTGKPVEILYWQADTGVIWYVEVGREEVFATTSEIWKDCDIEYLNEVDRFWADNPVYEVQDFKDELEDYLD